ncbi:ABC transporter G family member 37 [Citrus sinensis]|nr:ABC transporter G family member 37 [Citrus sinensis]
MELTTLGGNIKSSLRKHGSSYHEDDDELQLQWSAIERLPTFKRLRTSLFDVSDQNEDGSSRNESEGKKVTDVTKLIGVERHLFIEKLIKNIENDNLRLLQKLRERIDRVNVKLPTVEVRYKNLFVESECEIVHGKPLPTLWNSLMSSFSVSGEISYNGYRLDEFVPQKTAAYISQYDLHIPEMTVRETIDFSARCQGAGSRADMIMEVIRKEKEAGIAPDPDVDTYMKAIAVEGQKRNLQTDYVLKILGLDICAETTVGSALSRGISGGQKKRLTTGEMIVGPQKAFFMDEISTGLDSSTTFQIVTCLQQLVHITDVTALVSLLQPAPETFDLFDDIILMAEGKIVYHGPRSNVLQYFEDCGFRCPERKGIADFLQEVISKKDQTQYWRHNDIPYSYVSVDQFSQMFKESYLGKRLDEELSKPYDRSQCHKNALSFSKHALSKWELFQACMSRELLLMKRNSFVYVFKTAQLAITAIITMTVFIRTQMKLDLMHANFMMGSLYYAIVRLMTNGVAELSLTITRLPVVYRQRSFLLYPAWAYSLPASILKIPLSLAEALIWTALTYYVIGYSPEIERFFCQFFLLFALHLASTSMCRLFASTFQTMVIATTVGSLALVLMFLFGGFILPRCISLNEFLAPRWQKAIAENTTIGRYTLTSHGLNFESYFYWISVAALIGFMILFDLGFILALTYLKPPKMSRAIISKERFSQLQGKEDEESNRPAFPHTKSERMVLPFEQLTMAFKDVRYFVDTPPAMRKQGFNEKKLQLLHDITGAFRPGILTALMGVSGAGKTTLMDVLSGRKTGGIIQGEIRVGGYPKVQKTFARISGYCEQTDIHSPQITVEESVKFSAWLRLPPEIDSETKAYLLSIMQRFVEEVIETIELDDIKDSLVGIPGQSGLSTEQRKRLTIAVELVSNPSIIFMDEPTSGLDARAAAIVMRAVKNVVRTGRTTVCTIHQPSIDVFEAFDELLLMKAGGRIIYSGMLGRHSSKLIEYFQGISGVPQIKANYNPATWMLEVTSASTEAELGQTIELVNRLSEPQPGSKELRFPTRYPQSSMEQYLACLWKQHLSYWRSPEYNMARFVFMIFAALLFGAVVWQKGKEINKEEDLIVILGSMYIAVIFLGVNYCSTVLPYVATERTVLYREKFAGMYSPWAYSFAQVTVEIPYIMLHAIIYVAITYPAIGYYWSAYKVFWFPFTRTGTFKIHFFFSSFHVNAYPRKGLVAAVLIAFPVAFAILFAYCIGKLNYQRR